jgi:hypothetical protein
MTKAVVGACAASLALAAAAPAQTPLPAGQEFRANAYTTGNQGPSRIAVQPNGNFIVVWTSRDQDGSGDGVFARRFFADGSPRGAEFRVNTFTTGHQGAPNVADGADGAFEVVWASTHGGTSHDVFGQRYDAAVGPVGGEFQVNTYTTGRQFLFDFGGAVALDAAGNFVVTWLNAPDWMVDPGDIFGQRFDASGNRMGGEFAVNQSTVGWQDAATVGSDGAGNFVVTSFDRAGHDGSGWGAFARRFNGTTIEPAALTVDSAGNGVLEPGEAVDVRPSWRNLSSSAQAFGGAFSNFTGPAGPTYTTIDPTGDYGTVAAGATASCIDCYAVSVSNPAVRPALHWDAAVLETTSPVVAAKWWLVHVGRSFTDVSTTSPFYPSIETLLHKGITTGCIFGQRNTFCPAAPVTREQMAPLLLLAREGAGYSPAPCTEPPMFADVPVSSWFCRWIEELARRGVVAGCGGGDYCPTLDVSREAMAIFVLITLDPTINPPDCSPPNIYNDVPETSPFCRWIEELANRGAFADCGGGNYCPTSPVTREQMSVFLTATFGLTLYGP